MAPRSRGALLAFTLLQSGLETTLSDDLPGSPARGKKIVLRLGATATSVRRNHDLTPTSVFLAVAVSRVDLDHGLAIWVVLLRIQLFVPCGSLGRIETPGGAVGNHEGIEAPIVELGKQALTFAHLTSGPTFGFSPQNSDLSQICHTAHSAAGMTALEDDSKLVGAQIIFPLIEFDPEIATAGGDDGGNAGIITPVPSFFYTKKINDRFSLGISTTGAIGGGVDYGSTWAGRYGATRAILGAIGLSPAAAIKVNDKLSLGAGVSIIYSRFDMDVAIRSFQSGGAIPTLNGGDGKLRIKQAQDWGYQPFFGLQYALTDRALLGVVYRAEMDVNLEGSVVIENIGLPIGITDTEISWDNPQWLEAGLRYNLSKNNKLFLSGGWQEWSAFSENQISFSGGLLNPVAQLDRNFDDTWSLGVAFAHFNETTGKGYSVGFSYDSSPVDDADRTVDLPFDEIYKLSGAYGWKGKGGKDFALGATLYMIGDAAIDQTSQGVRVKGEFDNNFILFIGATVRF